MASIVVIAASADEPLAQSLVDALPRAARRADRGSRVVVSRHDRGGHPLEQADAVVLLASPESAVDADVDAALRRRLEARGTDALQVVVTDGTWIWRDGRLAAESTAVPPALHTAFRTEPRHMEYRGDRRARVGLRDPLFAEQVAEIVAPAIGTTKDALHGAEVSQQRRARMLTRVGIVALAALTLVAAGGAAAAAYGAQVAEQQRTRAEQERDDADSRRLAILSGQVAGEDGALARLLAVEAWRISETPEAAAALESAALIVDAWDPTAAVEMRSLPGHEVRAYDVAMSSAHVATVDAASAVRIWPLVDAASPIVVDEPARVLAWSHDGTQLAGLDGVDVRTFTADGAVQAHARLWNPATRIGAWGDGFVTAGTAVTLISGSELVAERPVADLGLSGELSYVGGSPDGSRVVIGTVDGDVVTLDERLEIVDRWRMTPAVDQFGARDSSALLAWDGAEAVLLPPDNAEILGPVLEGGAPDPQDGAFAGVYDRATGAGIAALAAGYLPLPAEDAVAIGPGAFIALTTGGLESPPVLATNADIAVDDVPLPADPDLVAASPGGDWIAIAGSGTAVSLAFTGEPVAAPTDDPSAAACAAAGRNLTLVEWNTHLGDRAPRATCEAYAPPA